MKEVWIDLSGWEGYHAPGEVGMRKVPVDERVVRALKAPAWPAARLWCPDTPSGSSELLAELMMTSEGPLLLAYLDSLDTTSTEVLLKPLHGRKMKTRIRGFPVMLDAAAEMKLRCRLHGVYRVDAVALQTAADEAKRGAVRNLRAERVALP